MSEIYVMDDIELEKDVRDAINTAIVETMACIRQEQVDCGPTEYVQPHVQLLEMTARVGAMRIQQAGLETLLAELAGEDEVFSDSWLSISSSLHALDSVFDQLYNLTKIYTDVIGNIGRSPELTQQMADKANEIVDKTAAESPNFRKIYDEYLSNSDIISDETSEESNP